MNAMPIAGQIKGCEIGASAEVRDKFKKSKLK